MNEDVAALLTFAAFSALAFGSYFETLGASVFLLCGAALFLTDVVRGLRALVRWWFLLLLPAYCVLSTLWSDYPQVTLRYSLQLSITIAIAIVIAGRLKPAVLVRSLFAAFAIATLFSVLLSLQAGAGAWHGMFESKNAFAAHVAFFLLTSLALFLDRSGGRALRLVALAGTVLSSPLLVLAQSAGVLLTIVPCAAAMILVAASARMSGPQKLFAISLALLGMACLALVIVANEQALLDFILDATGKDATLTGRTDLWSTGLALIAERPLFGTGYRAFWVVGNGAAEQLWAMFHLPSGAGFNFHNTYISNAVELGLAGIALQLFVIYGALLMLGWLAILRPSGFVVFLLGIQLMLVLRSFIEVEVFAEFSIRSMMAICSFIYAAQALVEGRRLRAGQSRPGYSGTRRYPLRSSTEGGLIT